MESRKMKCRKFEKYIFLINEGLSLKEKSELDKHILTCNSCRNLLESAEKSGIILNTIAKKEPVLSNPGILTMDIIRSVKEMEADKPGFINGILEKFLNWFFVPNISRMLIGSAVLIISWFIYQETFDQYQIAELENRLSQYSVNEYVKTRETNQAHSFLELHDFQNNIKTVNQILKLKYQIELSYPVPLNNLYHFSKETERKARQKYKLKYLKSVSVKGLKHLLDSNNLIK